MIVIAFQSSVPFTTERRSNIIKRNLDRRREILAIRLIMLLSYILLLTLSKHGSLIYLKLSILKTLLTKILKLLLQN